MPNSAAGTKEAQDQFNDKVSQIFGQTAESLAAGNPPVRDPAQLSKANKDELVKATGDYLLGMPVSAFSPRFVAGLNTELNRAGVSNVDLASTRLSDLGPVAAKYVAKRAEELQNAQPGVFYGLAVVGAAAAGYQGGSAGLEQLGIKPEFTQSFFDKAVVVRAAATWKPGFEDLQLTADVQGTVKLGEEATIGASVTSVNGGRASLVGNVTSSDIQAGANVTVDRTGVSGGASVTLGLPNAPVRGEVTATFGPGGVKGDARVEVGDTRLGGAITVGADQQGVNRAEIEGR